MILFKHAQVPEKKLIYYSVAPAFFLILNAVRLALSWGTGDVTLFQADYALPILTLWLAHRFRLKWWMTIIVVITATLLAMTIDAVSVAGRQFQWGPDAILPYLNASNDLPWRFIAPVAGAVVLIAALSAMGLLWWGKSHFALWPLVIFLIIATVIDARIGTSRFRDSRSNINVIATAIGDLGPLYVGSLIRGGSLRRIASGTMASELSQKTPPTEIMSVGIESFGLAQDLRQRVALVAPLVSGLRSDYEITQLSHPFFGSTLQGEIRELCGVRLVGNATDPRVKRRLGRCLPFALARRGYDTEALHGNGGQIYYRSDVYPVMGFRKAWFYSDLNVLEPKLKPCANVLFSGACDLIVYSKAVSLFDGSKRFVHVMSLDSHLPIPDKDLGICLPQFRSDRNLCNYSILIRRSLGNLARILRTSRHKPGLIYVYGDHAPPFTSKNLRDMFSQNEVPFVVLKTRRSAF